MPFVVRLEPDMSLRAFAKGFHRMTATSQQPAASSPPPERPLQKPADAEGACTESPVNGGIGRKVVATSSGSRAAAQLPSLRHSDEERHSRHVFRTWPGAAE